MRTRQTSRLFRKTATKEEEVTQGPDGRPGMANLATVAAIRGEFSQFPGKNPPSDEKPTAIRAGQAREPLRAPLGEVEGSPHPARFRTYPALALRSV